IKASPATMQPNSHDARRTSVLSSFLPVAEIVCNVCSYCRMYERRRYFSPIQEADLSAILSAVERKLATLPLPDRLTLPDGNSVGATDANVHLIMRDMGTLAHLVAGQVGTLGEDYVEGKFEVEGSMRDLMLLASSILTQS